MTYCVAMSVDEGLVFLSDTRTNAGVDHISTARKMSVFEQPGERMLVLLGAGNLSLTQAVLHELSEPSDPSQPTLWSAPTMADAARVIGRAVRCVHQREAEALQEFGVDFNCSFILGGQIANNRPRLFMIYAAGNFIEASAVNPYFQIGEAKYGKPIIDRVLTPSTPLDEAAKCALISMDSTLRSNLSVGLPLDLLVYEKDSLRVTRFVSIDHDNAYFEMIHRTWGERLRQVFGEIPDPDWHESPNVPMLQRERALVMHRAPVGADGVEHDLDAKPAQTLAQAEKGKAQRR
ncbi:proteasome-type protease [Paraburkholderia caledonica]|uniref:Proteasome-type protease n=1 Tax=Paraburkholderia caledonica TaxID=134536 RepID=A0ABU1L456_9BURK|nr:proteasome-type protease [Paraburkholderia caledonica]AXF16279.1 peptidase [Paraburkholderia caledonica]MDR6378001.1 putative proteasome-type protease [Paraburkholderia caledonica]OWJ62127.1 peptidase [Burkholderia sp. Bk]